jgi:hypothetical protein
MSTPNPTDPAVPCLVLKGAHAICAACGQNPKHISRLVREYRLPAWRNPCTGQATGKWLALPQDIADWLRRLRDQQLAVHDG